MDRFSQLTAPVNNRKLELTPKGNSGYDNPRENIDPDVKTQVIQCKEIIQNGVSYDLSTMSGGVTTFNTRTGAVVPAANDYTLDLIGSPAADKTFVMTTKQLGFTWVNPAGDPLTLTATGGYSGSVLHITQTGGNPGAGTYLITIDSADTDVEHIKSIGPATTTEVLCTYVSGDTQPRLELKSNGELKWGAGGSSATDTNLYRDSANVLKTDDSLLVTSTCSAATLYAGTQNVGTHITDGTIHYVSGAIWTAINLKANDIPYQSTSGAYIAHAADSTLHYVSGAIWAAIGNASASGANTILSNLGTTAINADLIFVNSGGGNRTLKTANITDDSSDNIYFKSGNVTSETGGGNIAGEVGFQSGNFVSGAEYVGGAACTLYGAEATQGGSVEFAAGNADAWTSYMDGGQIDFQSGEGADGGAGGDINFSSAANLNFYQESNVIFENLPAADPEEAGALWVSGAYVMISAG